MGKEIHYGAECSEKFRLHKRKVPIKILQNSISYKKLTGGRISLSHPEVKFGASMIDMFEILEWESRFTMGLNYS